MICRLLAMFGLLLFSWAVPSDAQESGASGASEGDTLVLAVDLSYPPLSYRTDDGRLTGFDVEVARALCAEMRRRCSLVETAFSDVVGRLRSGAIDLAVVSMSITPERARLIDFSIPYYKAPNQFIGRKGDASLANGLPNGLRIGVRQGTIYEVFARSTLEATNEVIGYALQDEIYLDLVMGRLDLGLGNALTMQAAFLDSDLGNDFELLGSPLDDKRYFGSGEAVALRKGEPELRASLDSAIERLRLGGDIADIWERYFDAAPGDGRLVTR